MRAASRVLSSKPCCRASGHDSCSIEGHRDRTSWSKVVAGLSAAQQEQFDVAQSSCVDFFQAPLPRRCSDCRRTIGSCCGDIDLGGAVSMIAHGRPMDVRGRSLRVPWAHGSRVEAGRQPRASQSRMSVRMTLISIWSAPALTYPSRTPIRTIPSRSGRRPI